MTYFPFRYSLNIEKQILWYLLAIIFFRKSYKKILDAGCGLGQNIRFFKFEEYLGIDIDPKRIARNKVKFNINKINFKSHDVIKEAPNFNNNYNLVVLIQVLTNSFFNTKEVKTALRNLIEVCQEKFVFNTSSKNTDQIHDINIFLDKSKIKYKTINYGIPKNLRKIKLPLISQLIALIYLLFILIDNKIMSNVKIIYICEIR
tara:strand:+ start:6546 stop:7154 length:609 start_codon:yes stop_codon:yes gene_type:complete